MGYKSKLQNEDRNTWRTLWLILGKENIKA